MLLKETQIGGRGARHILDVIRRIRAGRGRASTVLETFTFLALLVRGTDDSETTTLQYQK